jgi:hypothetical protein
MNDLFHFTQIVYWSMIGLGVFGVTSVMSMLIFDRWFRPTYCDMCQKKIDRPLMSERLDEKLDDGVKVRLSDT